MGDTIMGATSGELAQATPKDSQSQVEGQKTTKSIVDFFVETEMGARTPIFFIINMDNEVKGMEKRAVVTVVGKDQVGIISRVTTILAEHQMNIHDISQTILQDYFTMMMIVDLTKQDRLEQLLADFEQVEKEMKLKISIQLEDVFQAMHRV